MRGLYERLKKARELSWETFGKNITFYLPGMFTFEGLSGEYPAISITGDQCSLQCDHCRSKTLEPMVPATTPDLLRKKCLGLWKKGNKGVLISGGCDQEGHLPWKEFIEAIGEVRRETGLYISVHCGLVDYPTACALKEAGVDQALIDVIGDDETYHKIYHVSFGVSLIESSLDSLQRAGLPVVPHIVCGLDYGNIVGEQEAIEMISRFSVDRMVMVSLMRIPGTPAWRARPLRPEDMATLMVKARLRLPRTQISLGCARERGNTEIEQLAVDAGVNSMALPSEEAIKRAKDYGLTIRYQRTCCSVSHDFSKAQW